LSSFPANTNCNLNYMFAGTALSAFYTDMKDVLTICYSTNCGKKWDTLSVLTEDDIFNVGNFTLPYQPSWFGEWELKSLNIPNAARTSSVFFRFRYRPHTTPNGDITSNNFYIDRLNISSFPLGANTVMTEERNVIIAPNPTHGSSSVIIKGVTNSNANILVTDITGKVVYQVEQKITDQYTTIEIPAEAITVKGMYMVQVITNNQTRTEKLIVY